MKNEHNPNDSISLVDQNAGSGLLPLRGPISELLPEFSTEAIAARLALFVEETNKQLGDGKRPTLSSAAQEQVAKLVLEARVTLSKHKLARLRNVIVATATSTEDVTMSMLSQCVLQVEDIEARIAAEFYGLPSAARRENGQRRYFPLEALFQRLQQVPATTVRVAIQRLLGLGLIADAGSGVIGVQPLEYLERTDLGAKFVELLRE